MLRNLGIRSKLLAVLAVPMLVLVIGAAVVSLQAVGAAKDARQVRAISDGARSFSALVSALQAERRVSQAKLSGDYTLGGELRGIRKQTDAAAKATDDLTGRIGLAKLSNEAAKALATNLQARAKLGGVRRQVDKGTIGTAGVAAVYDAAIYQEIQIPARIAGSLSDQKLATQLRSYSELELAAELATQERDLGRQVLNDPRSVSAYATAVARENDAVQAFWYDASIAERSRMSQAMDAGSVNKQFLAARAGLLAVANGKAPAIEDQSWVYLANHNLGSLQGLASQVAANAAVSAADSAAAATNRSWQILGLALLVLLLPVLLALIVARAITRPLRSLTDAAGQVRDELPRLVETMATPGETPDADLIRIPVLSQDEVGKLAAAFNDVNQTTMRIAREQAALRGSIAEMFVNVARRNHVLLSRQLSFIDQLERTEEDPDTLDDLFKLDHLATRMRRNAESLIVLAGIDSGRRVRQPMPLSDVIRTAISEIEKYERVDMALRADPPVVGHVALTTAHLLAELLENATQFSNPDTRVFVVTSYSRRGVRVKITDAGLGMTYDEITDANQRIANPPATDVVGASRLGFFVVGRLARRLDARVTLRAARDRGTVVVIDLPAALFVAGTVAEVTGIDDDDEAVADSGDPRSADSQAAAEAAAAANRGLPSRGNANPHSRVPLSSEPPAPTPPKVATPFPYDFGAPPADGAGGQPAAQPGAQPAAARSGLPQRGPDGGLTPGALPRGTATSLPRRSRSGAVQNLVDGGPAPSEPVAMPTPLAAPVARVAEPVAESRPAKRPGLFSGFRSSRSATPTPDPLLTPLPELPPVKDEARDRVEDQAPVEASVEAESSVEEAVEDAVESWVEEAVEARLEEGVEGSAEDAAGQSAHEPVLESVGEPELESVPEPENVSDSEPEGVVDSEPEGVVASEPEIVAETQLETGLVEEPAEPVDEADDDSPLPSEDPAPVSPLAASLAASLALAAAQSAEPEAETSADVEAVHDATLPTREIESVHEMWSLPTRKVDTTPEPALPVRDVHPVEEAAPVLGKPFDPASLLADDDVPLTLIEGVETANDVAPLQVSAPEAEETEPKRSGHRRFFPLQRRHAHRTPDAPQPSEDAAPWGVSAWPAAEVEPEAVADVEPEAVADVEAEAVADVEPDVVPEVEPEAVVADDVAPAEAASEPVAEGVTDAEAEPVIGDVDLPVWEPEAASEAEVPTADGESGHRNPTQRATLFQHFPTRRSHGRHYKGKDEATPEPGHLDELAAAEPLTEQPAAFPQVAEPIAGRDVEPVAEPVDERVAFVAEVVAEPVAIAVEEPVEARVDEGVTEAVAEGVAEPVDEPVDEPVAFVAEVVAEPVAIAVEEPVEAPVDEGVTELVAEPVDEGVTELVDEPVDEPVAAFVPEPAPQPLVQEPLAQEAAAPEPTVPAPPIPAHAAVLDILPGGVTPKNRRLPRPWSRAMKPPVAPTVQRSAPPAYTRAPVPPPVVPTPVAPPVSPNVAPVPVGRELPAHEDYAHAAAATPMPLSSHFGTRTDDAVAAGAPTTNLFGTPATSTAPTPGSEESPAASNEDYEQMLLRERSAIASEALSELSRLSGYRPEAVETRGPQSLARRTPQSTPGVEPDPSTTAAVPHRERNATDVRSMLSGFRAGVERGRADQGRGSEG